MAIAPETVAELNAKAAGFYRRALAQEPAAQAYLASRGFTPETIAAWGLGYAPRGGRALLREFESDGWSETQMVEAGLARAGERGVSDLLRDRIVLPIVDEDGVVVAFGSRVFREGDDGPKYLNSPETPLFKKSRTLFGLDHAVAAIRAEGHAVVVEGNLDAISLHQAGYRTVVAVAGTALTEEHLERLGRIAARLTVVLDADEAGEKATRRAMLLPNAAGVEMGVLRIPEGPNGEKVDPDLLVRADPAAFGRLMGSERMSRWEYLYQSVLAPHRDRLAEDVEARVSWKNDWAAMVRAHAGDRAEAAKLIARMERKLGLPEGLVASEITADLPAPASEQDTLLLRLLAAAWPAVRPLVADLPLGPAARRTVEGWGETAALPAAIAAAPVSDDDLRAARVIWIRTVRPAAKARLTALVRAEMAGAAADRPLRDQIARLSAAGEPALRPAPPLIA